MQGIAGLIAAMTVPAERIIPIEAPAGKTEPGGLSSLPPGSPGAPDVVERGPGRTTTVGETAETVVRQNRRWYAYFTTKDFYIILLLGFVFISRHT